MRDLCVIGLLLIASPWVVGIVICILKFFGEKYDKLVRYFELLKDEHNKERLLIEYKDWYTNEQKAVIQAYILNNRYQRKHLFSLNDLNILKAFI